MRNTIETHIVCSFDFLSRNERIAAPNPVATLKRQSRVSKEAGTYVMMPQPEDMPKGWEQAIALNPDGETGSYIYHKYVRAHLRRFSFHSSKNELIL
jgi:hypothetical protein